MPLKSRLKPKYVLSKKIKVGVLFGGSSSERKISRRSGRAVMRALQATGFCTLALDPARPAKMRRDLKKIDLAFIALHGRGGEDGTIQRFLDRKRIPYVGSNARASLLAFDKVRAKKRLLKHRIPTPSYLFIRRAGDWHKLSGFPEPFFIKPNREGSSIGAFPVENFTKSVEKIRRALRRYKVLLAEEKIEGREFTVGVLKNRALPVIELVPKRTFYDYRAKYTKGMTEYRVPAPILPQFAARLKRLALSVHRVLGLRDFSRVDFMTDKKGRPFVLEANTIPGFTALSLLPKAARAGGISFENLCYQLIEAAWKRRNQGRKLVLHGQEKKA
ncbi:MAG: D-alanine--D-alanine ligase [Candidatus Omnitrophica bacterium]|nr:D-alanine--D-alanine ligase [Candidatus Omnitrophota bacterium]